jgi:predicted ATPase
MIKSLTFIEDYELPLEKESQKRWGVKTHKPTRWTREKKPWKTFMLFKKGLHIDFREDINIIVGENGSGKSSLFGLIKAYVGEDPNKSLFFHNDFKTDEEYIAYHRKNYHGEISIDGDISYRNSIFFSAEHDNPVVAIPKMLNPNSKDFVALTSELFNAQEESHGESLLPVLKYLLENANNACIFLDEPETALSLRNQIWLVKAIQKSSKINGNQVFLSTHALALIQQFQTIFDMESRQWVDREQYINKMLHEKNK